MSDEVNISRDEVLSALHDNGIEHRIITGGNILRNDVISFYDHFVVFGAQIHHFLGPVKFFLSCSLRAVNAVRVPPCVVAAG